MKFIFYCSLSSYVKKLVRKVIIEHVEHNGRKYTIMPEGRTVYIRIYNQRPMLIIRGDKVIKEMKI